MQEYADSGSFDLPPTSSRICKHFAVGDFSSREVLQLSERCMELRFSKLRGKNEAGIVLVCSHSDIFLEHLKVRY